MTTGFLLLLLNLLLLIFYKDKFLISTMAIQFIYILILIINKNYDYTFLLLLHGMYLYHYESKFSKLIPLFIGIGLITYFTFPFVSYFKIVFYIVLYVSSLLLVFMNVDIKVNRILSDINFLKRIFEKLNKTKTLDEFLEETCNLTSIYLKCSFSSILLYDNKRNRIQLLYTNVSKNLQGSLLDICNEPAFINVFSKNEWKLIVREHPLPLQYLHGRNIRSVYCVPLDYNDELKGILLLEDINYNSFSTISDDYFYMIKDNITLGLLEKLRVKQIEDMNKKDGLTGVFNQRYFAEYCETFIRSREGTDRGFCFVTFDIDHFKRCNDTYGHQFGDKVLKIISDIAANSIREYDLIGRTGGEEFCIIMDEEDINNVKNRVEEIRSKIENTKILNDNTGEETSVTCSFGISQFPNDALTMYDLKEKADTVALYYGKTHGRNQVIVYSPELEAAG